MSLSSETPAQHQRLLAYLKQYGSINTIEARQKLGVMSPPQRIWDLIRRGHTITVERIKVQTPISTHIRVALYHYHPEQITQ